jgi:hypothetical protein
MIALFNLLAVLGDNILLGILPLKRGSVRFDLIEGM